MDSRAFRRLPVAEQRRLIHWLALLLKPELSAEDVASLKARIEREAGRPLPAIPSIVLLLPLIAHHLEQIGAELASVFSGPPVRPLDKPALLRRHQRHRQALSEAIAVIEESTSLRPLAVKGSALAPYLTSPALRLRADEDLYLPPKDLPKAEHALLRAGWQRVYLYSETVWRHDNGVVLDLQRIEGRFLAGLWQRAVPHERLPGAQRPEHGDHLALLAIHLAHHGGERFWRDAFDARILFSQTQELDRLCQAALSAATHHGERQAVAAFLAALAEIAQVPIAAPTLDPHDRALFRLYRQCATETLSVPALNLVPLRFPFAGLIRRMTLQSRAPAGGATTSATIEDPVLGNVYPKGLVARARQKFSVLWILWRTGRLKEIRAFLRLQQRAADQVSPQSANTETPTS